MAEDVDEVETPAYAIAQQFAHGNEECAYAVRLVLRKTIGSEREACATIVEDEARRHYTMGDPINLMHAHVLNSLSQRLRNR